MLGFAAAVVDIVLRPAAPVAPSVAVAAPPLSSVVVGVEEENPRASSIRCVAVARCVCGGKASVGADNLQWRSAM